MPKSLNNLTLKVTIDEANAYQDAAHAKSLTTSAWAREILNTALTAPQVVVDAKELEPAMKELIFETITASRPIKPGPETEFAPVALSTVAVTPILKKPSPPRPQRARSYYPD